jgi:hypothetical protein
MGDMERQLEQQGYLQGWRNEKTWGEERKDSQLRSHAKQYNTILDT